MPERVDRMLHDYFRAELPSPWPAPQLPDDVPAAVRPARSIRNGARWAIAASLLFLLLGYLTLSAWFPVKREGLRQVGPNIGLKPDRNEVRPMPMP
jgi:hypothetical protein